MEVRISQAQSMITAYLKAKLVPLLVGSPGMGKSQIYQQIADEYGLLMIDVRLGQSDVTDLCGFPKIIGTKAGYVPMDTFPIVGDEVPAGYNGWLLLFDELTSAPPTLQAAAYKIILDRKVGKHSLHPNVAICAAGNLETDNAVVHPMSTALKSRLVHIQLGIDSTEWTNWGSSNGIDHRITDYIKWKPEALFTFSPDHTDATYACPRTWEFANRVLGVTTEDSKDRLPMLAGTISEGVAREFLGFIKIYKDLPTTAQIQANPDGIKVPVEPSILFALTGTISHHAINDASFNKTMVFIMRLPVEFQVVTLRETVRRNNKMMAHPAIQKWVAASAENLF
jgi:hypothetical protein